MPFKLCGAELERQHGALRHLGAASDEAGELLPSREASDMSWLGRSLALPASRQTSEASWLSRHPVK